MSFKRVIFLILAVFAVYHAFVTPLPADSDVSYRMGALTANVLLPVLLLYFALKCFVLFILLLFIDFN